MTRLSVNLNKVALLRNSRHTGVPDVLHFARIAHDAGAEGLTVQTAIALSAVLCVALWALRY